MTKMDIPEEVVEVWQDNWDSFWLFEALSTQWRAGAGGLIGLDYSSILPVAQMLGLKKKKLKQIFPDLRVMEAVALQQMHQAEAK